jgi:hypothetical protein
MYGIHRQFIGDSSPRGYLSSLESSSHLWEGGETPVLYQARTFGSGFVIPIRRDSEELIA